MDLQQYLDSFKKNNPFSVSSSKTPNSSGSSILTNSDTTNFWRNDNYSYQQKDSPSKRQKR